MSTKVSSLAVQIEAIGVDKVKTALRELGSDAERTSDHLGTHYGKAARHLSLVTNEAVRAGEIGGNALQKILTIGGDMAGMFGVSGAVVGALAVTGLAIYNYFDRAKKAIEETAKAARAELRSLRDESATSAATALNRVAGGDIYADKAIERGSMADLVAEKKRIIARTTTDYNAKTGDAITSLSSDDASRLAEVDAELSRRNQILKEGIPLLQATATAEGKTLIAEGKKGLESKAQRDAEEAFKRRLDQLKELGKASLDVAGNVAGNISSTFDKNAKAGTQAGVFDAGNFASEGTAELAKKFQQAHPFDYEKYFDQLAGGTEGLLPKIDSPLNQMADQVRNKLSSTLGNAIYEGFKTAFSGKGLGGILKGFGKTLMGGLGQIISDQGMLYLEYSGIMQAFTPLLGNPFTAGFAGAAIGAALIALGAALGAAASGGGGGHTSASIPRPPEITNIKLTATSVADQARYDPKSPTHMTVIGPGDATAFRQIQQGLDNHARR